MEKRNIEATRNALLEAAGKLMVEKNDPSEVTSRAIAKEAQVNLAMINYCFGSREELLFEVFRSIREDTFENENFNIAFIEGSTPKENLIELYTESIRFMLKHYNFVKAITKFVLLNRRIDAERGSLAFIKEHFGDRKTDGECRMAAFEISSLHELAVLRYEELRDVCGIDLTDDVQLRKYVEGHINMFLGE